MADATVFGDAIYAKIQVSEATPCIVIDSFVARLCGDGAKNGRVESVNIGKSYLFVTGK